MKFISYFYYVINLPNCQLSYKVLGCKFCQKVRQSRKTFSYYTGKLFKNLNPKLYILNFKENEGDKTELTPLVRWSFREYHLKGQSHEIFDPRFCSLNCTPGSPDSWAKMVLHIDSNSRRYSIKGTLTRDFRPLVFFTNQPHLGPWLTG
jgi:hypothetical protein